jgi:hypothetical protein
MEEISSTENEIHYDKKDIIEKIESTGKYETDTTMIIKWEDDMNQNSEMYIVKNEHKNLPFLGVVNFEFKREGYCINNYINGDEYFGYYSNDLRNKQGLYIYKPKQIINSFLSRQFYFGLWENDEKHGRGNYLWLKDDNTNINNNNKLYNPFDKNFDDADFQAFVGEIEYNSFKKGTLLKKEGDNYFVYHGFLEEKSLKKNGKDCFYYSAKLEEMFYGNYKNDVFTDGFVGKFDENGEIENIVKYQNKKIIAKENLSKFENIKSVIKKMTTFRNVIMSKDYFGILYSVFKNIIDFKNKKMNDINIFNSDEYLDLMDIFASYNNVSIFKDIEKYLVQ